MRAKFQTNDMDSEEEPCAESTSLRGFASRAPLMSGGAHGSHGEAGAALAAGAPPVVSVPRSTASAAHHGQSATMQAAQEPEDPVPFPQPHLVVTRGQRRARSVTEADLNSLSCPVAPLPLPTATGTVPMPLPPAAFPPAQARRHPAHEVNNYADPEPSASLDIEEAHAALAIPPIKVRNDSEASAQPSQSAAGCGTRRPTRRTDAQPGGEQLLAVSPPVSTLPSPTTPLTTPPSDDSSGGAWQTSAFSRRATGMPNRLGPGQSPCRPEELGLLELASKIHDALTLDDHLGLHMLVAHLQNELIPEPPASVAAAQFNSASGAQAATRNDSSQSAGGADEMTMKGQNGGVVSRAAALVVEARDAVRTWLTGSSSARPPPVPARRPGLTPEQQARLFAGMRGARPRASTTAATTDAVAAAATKQAASHATPTAPPTTAHMGLSPTAGPPLSSARSDKRLESADAVDGGVPSPAESLRSASGAASKAGTRRRAVTAAATLAPSAVAQLQHAKIVRRCAALVDVIARSGSIDESAAERLLRWLRTQPCIAQHGSPYADATDRPVVDSAPHLGKSGLASEAAFKLQHERTAPLGLTPLHLKRLPLLLSCHWRIAEAAARNNNRLLSVLALHGGEERLTLDVIRALLASSKAAVQQEVASGYLHLREAAFIGAPALLDVLLASPLGAWVTGTATVVDNKISSSPSPCASPQNDSSVSSAAGGIEAVGAQLAALKQGPPHVDTVPVRQCQAVALVPPSVPTMPSTTASTTTSPSASTLPPDGARILLHEAIRGGNEAAAVYLCRYATVRDAIAADARKLVSAACRRGSIALVNVLLSHAGQRCPLAAPGVLKEGLWQAAGAGHVALTEFLLHRVPAHAAQARVDWGRLLAISAFKDRHDIVRRLLREPYILEQAPVDGNTVLRWACHSGHMALVSRLLQNPGVVAAADAHRNNAARGAASQGHHAIVRALLDLPAVIACERNETRALQAGVSAALVPTAAGGGAAAGYRDANTARLDEAPAQQELKFYSLLAIAAVRREAYLIQALFDKGVHAGPGEFLSRCRWVLERADGANAEAAAALLRACHAWSRRKALVALRAKTVVPEH